MEVHAKAETNARAILSSVATNSSPAASSTTLSSKTTSQPLSSVSLINPIVQQTSASTPAGTTLISITTPSSNLTSIKSRTPPSRGRGRQPKTTLSSRNTNVIPTGLRIMCCSCNQLFNSQNDLSNHKCVVPVVTITGTKPNGETFQQQSQQTPIVMSTTLVKPLSTGEQTFTTLAQFTNNTSAVIKDETMSDNLEEDPEKLVLDLAAQLTQAVQEEEAEKLKQKQLQKVEQLLYQQNVSHNRQLETKKTATPTTQAKGRKSHSSKNHQLNQSPSNKSLTKLGENQIEEIKFSTPVSTLNQSVTVGPNKVESVKKRANLNSTQEVKQGEENNNEFTANIEGGLIEAAPGEQYIMLQQPDGQYVQICVPEGMDIEDVVRSLNLTLTGEVPVVEGGSEINEAGMAVTECGETAAAAAIEGDLVTAPVTVVQEEGQLSQEAVITEVNEQNIGEVADDQQVIYLPVNEDGTCAIDATALAMLTGGGDLPIIVTSND